MDMRDLGTTGLTVSALGFGAGSIGADNQQDADIEKLLNRVLDLGINLIDTSIGYGRSEERIGRFLKHRRQEMVLATKVGYGIDGIPDWTYDCVTAGVERALKVLQTDTIDIIHLHTCDLPTLQRGEVTQALQDAKQAGKVRVIGYAGDNEPLLYAIDSGAFGSAIASVNLCDQRFINQGLWEAKQRGMGVIAKRPVANAPWRFAEQPRGHYCEPYWERLQTMDLHFDLPMQEVALRFAAFTYGIDSIIVGSTNLKHIRENLTAINKGALPKDMVNTLRDRFLECNNNWRSQI
ncbi:aldo/keto reductase [Acanthopleuribacter pedis]|uniref:Aldo/keto reductase n=1 Tax=Acanthopleuribacter pedis TaxID=442870 RepID=A0A8J7Q639_9BACT|nr:aldo/keto reductase [Acanthopleuribacter pedis]MBO1318736.1 aldo/keto reductase [Acanthopleuribacter pedis]